MRSAPAILAALAVFVSGCAFPENPVVPVTPAMAQFARAHGSSAESLEEGRRIFGGPCTACHRPYSLENYSLGKWQEIVGEMSQRAKLDASRKAALLAYIAAAHEPAAASPAR